MIEKKHRGADALPKENGWYKVLVSRRVIDYVMEGNKRKAVGSHVETVQETWLYRDGWHGTDLHPARPKTVDAPEWWTEEGMMSDSKPGQLSVHGAAELLTALLRDWRKDFALEYKLFQKEKQKVKKEIRRIEKECERADTDIGILGIWIEKGLAEKAHREYEIRKTALEREITDGLLGACLEDAEAFIKQEEKRVEKEYGKKR